MIRQPPTFARVNDKARIIFLVIVLRVDREHLAHLDAETLAEDLVGRSHRGVIGN